MHCDWAHEMAPFVRCNRGSFGIPKPAPYHVGAVTCSRELGQYQDSFDSQC